MIILSDESRVLLKRQLMQQAEMLVSENNDVKLVQSVLAACLALLRVAEKSIPKSLSQNDFNSVYASYLGISGKVEVFYSGLENYFDERQSQTLEKILEALQSSEKGKKEQDDKISEVEKKIEELKDVNERVDNFVPNVKRLIEAVDDAKSTYAEMVAYCAELERIQNGMKDDGYVDIVSFTQKIQGMNTQGRELMNQYDELLKNITADVEALQEKIKVRAGVHW